MAKVFVTSRRGTLVAEVDGVRRDELTDCLYELGIGYGETLEVDYDMTDYGSDIYGLIDAIYELMGE